MKHLLAAILCLFSLIVSAQVTITGKVVNRSDQKPVADASVYVNNSGIGTRTDANGSFALTIYSNAAEIIVTHISFEKQSVAFKATRANESLKVEMEPRVQSMESVIVRTKNKETWAKWKDLFIESFLGKSEFARKCTILNHEVIWFRYNKKTQTIIAKAREPIIIENKALGFMVSFDLDSFSYSFQTNLVYRLGSSFFTPIKPASKDEAQDQAVNRLIAYRGSKMHFFRSVFADNYKKEGFTVYKFSARHNEEKARLRQMFALSQAKNYEKNVKGEVTLATLASNRDSAEYYQDIMATPDYLFQDSTKTDFTQRVQVLVNGKTKALDFMEDTLLVAYDSEMEKVFTESSEKINKRYKQLSNDLKLNYSFFANYAAMSRKQFTLLSLVHGDYLWVEQNGYCYNADLFEDGYMAWKKMAHMLPWDYDPELDQRLIKQ